MSGAALSESGLGAAMPFHLLIGEAGQIRGCGPSLQKMLGRCPVGQASGDLLKVLRPAVSAEVAELKRLAGARILVQIAGLNAERLPALVVALEEGQGVLMNLGLGAEVRRLVSETDLTMHDFSPCDPTIEMLFLIEANAAALAESDKLNARLDEARAKAEVQAATDKLTGLYNRRAMDTELQRMHDLPELHPFGLMHLDLDHFKAVNDTLGHAAGDHVLRHVAQVLKAQVRKGDIVARVGGDEFVLIFPQCPDLPTLDRIAKRMIAHLERPIDFEGQPCRISASIGTTVSSFYPEPGPDKMLSDADEALYISKEAGRACHTIFTPEPGQKPAASPKTLPPPA